MPSAEFEQLVSLIKSSQASRADVTVELYRERMDQVSVQFPLPPGTRAEPVEAAGVPCEWVTLGDPADETVLLYIHGGCYVSGSVASIREFAARLAGAGRMRVLTVDYRLAPEHCFPAAVDDVIAVYEWLVTQVDPSRVVVAGESAGGGLTVALLVALRDRGLPLPAAAVPISPWVDLTLTARSLIENEPSDSLAQREGLVMGAEAYLGEADPRDPLASPLFAELGGLPPMLVQVGGGEILRDDAHRLVDAVKDGGGMATLDEHEAMFHIWQYFGAWLPEGRAATTAIAEFARAHAS